MGIPEVHFMALSGIRERISQNEKEYTTALKALNEAVKMGDLRENAEYDIARAEINRLLVERDELLPVLEYDPIKSMDSVKTIERGSVIKIEVYSVTPVPMDVNSEQFTKMIEEDEPIFPGIIMYGGALPIHSLLEDNILSNDAPISKFIEGKKPGRYSVPVPGGFSNIVVTKQRLADITSESLGSEYNE